ncbi:MAG: DNA gyrase modulator, partial [Pseudomonadota bacterium]
MTAPQPPDLHDLADQVLAAARKAGAESADTLVVDGRSVSIDVRAGALEQAERSEGIDLGLRVLLGPCQACVSISDSAPDAIASMAERAVAMAREAPEDPTCGLASADELARKWDADALELADGQEPGAADLQDFAMRAEAAALAVPGVAQTQGATAYTSWSNRVLATSGGFVGGYARGAHGLNCVAISGQGLAMERDYMGEARTFLADMPDPETIGNRYPHQVSGGQL